MEVQAAIDYGRIDRVSPRPPRSRTIEDLLRPVEKEKKSLPDFRDKVFCLCLGFMGNAADARDLTQDTFAMALLHYDLDKPDYPQAWLMRIARNQCLDQLRRRKVRGPHESISEFTAIDWRTPEDNAGAEEEIRFVRKAIANLPPHLRKVLVMREYGELAYEEIGAALRISRGTVMSRLNRARQAVLRLVREEQK
jgi:RNA polymerase sigma-70 factor (ECF subfamily)